MSRLEENLQHVWRLEYIDGLGCYCRLPKARWKGAAHKVLKEDSVRHPSPHSDPLLVAGMERMDVPLGYFGFGSIKSLRAWIPKESELIGLHGYGIKLAVYVCPRDKVIVGEKQLMFYESIRKRQYDILKYFKIKA